MLSAFGVYVGWTLSDAAGVAGLPWTLLLAAALVLPPWGLCQLAGLGVRSGGATVARVGWLFDALAWLLGTVVSAFAFSVAYGLGHPDPWVVLLFLAYSVPAYVFATLVRAVAGRRYGHVARLFAGCALTVAAVILALRVVLIVAGDGAG